MIAHDVEQGSREWVRLRLGIPTASEFDNIVTPTGKPVSGEKRKKYLIYLATESLLNRQLDSIDHLEWVARGKMLEPAAAAAYEFLEDVKTEKVGFVTTDDRLIGCSPDLLIPERNAAAELKAPAPHTHLFYLVYGFGPDYFVQAQGQIYVGKFDYVDRYSWHPEMPPAKTRTRPEPSFQATLHDELSRFCEDLAKVKETARDAGRFNTTPDEDWWQDYLRRLEEKAERIGAG